MPSLRRRRRIIPIASAADGNFNRRPSHAVRGRLFFHARVSANFHSHTAGSLTPTFVSARPVSLAVRLAYAFTLSCMVSVHAEPTFERLRYFLGGDRPSQTVHLTVSQDQIHGLWLESQYYKSGIPRLTPQQLTPLFRCLPPILYM